MTRVRDRERHPAFVSFPRGLRLFPANCLFCAVGNMRLVSPNHPSVRWRGSIFFCVVLLSGASKKNSADAAGTTALLFGRHAPAKLSAAAEGPRLPLAPGPARPGPAWPLRLRRRPTRLTLGSSTAPSRGFDRASLSNGRKGETLGLSKV